MKVFVFYKEQFSAFDARQMYTGICKFVNIYYEALGTFRAHQSNPFVMEKE
jgi:hypothetical protein